MTIPAPRTNFRDDALLAVLFFAQGLPTGLAWLGLPAWLRSHGAALDTIGLVSLTFLPWALKFLWAAPVERLAVRLGCGRVIAATQLVAALAYAALAAVDLRTHFLPGLALLTLLAAACATQDVATDRHAIARRGAVGAARINTLRFAGFTGGMLAGGAGLLLAGATAGWTAFMLACAVGMVVAATMAIRMMPMARTLGGVPEPRARDDAARVHLRGFFERTHPWTLLALALLFKSASAASESMVKSFWVDHGVTLEQVGIMTAVNLGLWGLVGAPLGAWLLGRKGLSARGVAAGAGLCVALLLGLLAACIHGGLGITWLPTSGIEWDWVYVLLPALQAVADGVASMGFFTVFTRAAVGRQPGTDLTLVMCAESLGGLVLGALAGVSATSLGYAAHFALAGAAYAAYLAWAWRALPRVDVHAAVDERASQPFTATPARALP